MTCCADVTLLNDQGNAVLDEAARHGHTETVLALMQDLWDPV